MTARRLTLGLAIGAAVTPFWPIALLLGAALGADLWIGRKTA
ncbi:hypothetical protein [Sphingomonas trueperi]